MSTSLSFDKMYKLKDPLGNRALRLTWYDDCNWLTKKMAAFLFRGELTEPPQPIHLHSYMGGQPMDFLWSGMIPVVCISERVVELLTTHKLSGWSTYPVEVYNREGERLLNYFGFSVTGRVGKQVSSRSKVVEVPVYPGSQKLRKVYKGLYFDETSWDGSDFCTEAGTYRIIVTHAVHTVFKQNKVNNVRLIRLSDVETDVSLDKYKSEK